jgi:hypothetical protein
MLSHITNSFDNYEERKKCYKWFIVQ